MTLKTEGTERNNLTGYPVVQDGELEPKPMEDGLWKKFMLACDSPMADRRKEKAVWETWESVVPFLRGETYTEGDETRFRDAINAFSEAFVACWGEGQVTHYMHILYAHGPWLIKEHGSLGVWQCQGMEKSHWVARGNWQKHTNHDGGRQLVGDKTKSASYQLMRFDYRMMFHRRRKRAEGAVLAGLKAEKLKAKECAAQRQHSWIAVASEEKKAQMRQNAAGAREVFLSKLEHKRVLREVRKREFAKWDGVIESFMEGTADAPPEL